MEIMPLIYYKHEWPAFSIKEKRTSKFPVYPIGPQLVGQGLRSI